MSTKKYTNIGGQAVIEGVMMRSPHYCAVAIRKPDQRIIIKERLWRGIFSKFSLAKKPFFRGIATLIESMVNGVDALSYSANVAAANSDTTKDKKEELSSFVIFSSIFFAFIVGIALFVIAPHLLTLWLGKLGAFDSDVKSPLFHLIDGVIKVIFLISYIYLIAFMKDIRRVFQYHGAEHKSIYTFEAGEDLTVENARKYTTLHPRCGTSFLLFLLIISILVFSAVFPVIGLTQLSENRIIHHALLIIVKILLMFPIAGMSYEFIRFSASHTSNLLCKVLIFPGLILQKLTTLEPTDDQLEVALVSLKRVLLLEKKPSELSKNEIEIQSLAEIMAVPATVSEFLG